MNIPRRSSLAGNMLDITYEALRSRVERKGYVWFTGAYNLNVVGIRSNDPKPSGFDDTFCVGYEDRGGNKRIFTCPFTADPGLYYLQNPINPKGTAIMKPGQYRGAYRLGTHRGYLALVQRRPVTVYRDGNKDDRLNYGGTEDTGMHAVNIHRTVADGIAATIGKFSAGCQVIASSDDFNYIKSLVRRQKAVLGSDVVTYTLLLWSDL